MADAATEHSEAERKDTISFSVRLTGIERDLLSRAAEKRGWTLTNLLKIAAREKAVHILNTSAPSRVDFRGTAQEIARQVFTPRSARTLDLIGGEPRFVQAEAYEHLAEALINQDQNPVVEVSPWQMSPDFLSNIREAARYGGTEFLDLIVEAAEAITSRSTRNLPDPIDPSSI